GLPGAELFRPFEMPGGLGTPRRLQLNPDAANAARRAVRMINGEFVTQSSENGVTITVKGTKDGDQVKVTEVRIKDGDNETKAESVDKAPEQYRAKVKELVESVK